MESISRLVHEFARRAEWRYSKRKRRNGRKRKRGRAEWRYSKRKRRDGRASCSRGFDPSSNVTQICLAQDNAAVEGIAGCILNIVRV